MKIIGEIFQELTRQQYIENISAYEKLYLLITTDNKVFLRAEVAADTR
ncbi:MAG: hypothetical protein IJT73_07425 [Selenomonadaceae bacterium]|nr:hypothetical protein [Selenomonadaceae bacterium]